MHPLNRDHHRIVRTDEGLDHHRRELPLNVRIVPVDRPEQQDQEGDNDDDDSRAVHTLGEDEEAEHQGSRDRPDTVDDDRPRPASACGWGALLLSAESDGSTKKNDLLAVAAAATASTSKISSVAYAIDDRASDENTANATVLVRRS